MTSINRSLSSSLSGAASLGISHVLQPINHRSGTHSPSPGPYQPRETSAALISEDLPDSCVPQQERLPISPDAKYLNAVAHSCDSSIHHRPSLGIYDSLVPSNRLRPDSLSVTIPSSINSIGEPSIMHAHSPIQCALSSVARPTAISPHLPISPHCIDFDSASSSYNPTSGRRSSLSSERLSGSRQMAAGPLTTCHLSTWNSSGASHRSSLLMAPLFGQQLSNPGSAASPGPGYVSFTGELIFLIFAHCSRLLLL